MTDQEKFNAELQMKTNLQEAKFNMLVNELKEQRQDIRDLNKRIDDKFDVLDKKIDDKFDKLSEQMHNMLIGVGGMMVALGAFLVAVLK
ncbi:MAG: hypothetical protein IJK81_07840 [Selenomonadaceae bacterium]|nr:hypothetical protein [Selenomonadaceae bacterium]